MCRRDVGVVSVLSWSFDRAARRSLVGWSGDSSVMKPRASSRKTQIGLGQASEISRSGNRTEPASTGQAFDLFRLDATTER